MSKRTRLPNPAGANWKRGIHRRMRARWQNRERSNALVHVEGLGRTVDTADLKEKAAAARQRFEQLLAYVPANRRRTRRLRGLLDDLTGELHDLRRGRDHDLDAVVVELRNLVEEAEAADAALGGP